MQVTHRPGSLLRRSCYLQGPIPKPEAYERHLPLHTGHAGIRPICFAWPLPMHPKPETRPHTNNRSVRLPLCSCGDLESMGWKAREGDRFFSPLLVTCRNDLRGLLGANLSLLFQASDDMEKSDYALRLSYYA